MKERKEYFFSAYNGPTVGYYTINGYTYYNGEDFRTAKRYKEYLDCGFNILQVRGVNAYSGEEWEGSNCQRVFKEAWKAGCKKLIVTDNRFERWISVDRNIVGEGRLFANEQELDKAVAECVAPYCKQKGFFGIQLFDEPQYCDFPAYGQLARSLKRVLPGVYLQCNLLPLAADLPRISPEGDENNDRKEGSWKMAQETAGHHEIYKNYISDFTDITEMDSILFDEYPFRREYIISGNTIPNFQIVARVCKQRGIEFRIVLQSFSHVWNNVLRNRKITESDMYWQTNLALGFGAREFSFYTYLAKPNFDYGAIENGEIDGAAFINLDGSRTALYDYTKRIIKEMKSFAKVALKYNYESSHIVTGKEESSKDFEWTRFLYENRKCPIDVTVDKGVAIVTKQTNAKDELYMIENIGNVRDELFDNAPPMQVAVYLPKGKKNFYFRGKKIRVPLNEEGKYLLSLKVGDAIFIEIK